MQLQLDFKSLDTCDLQYLDEQAFDALFEDQNAHFMKDKKRIFALMSQNGRITINEFKRFG